MKSLHDGSAILASMQGQETSLPSRPVRPRMRHQNQCSASEPEAVKATLEQFPSTPGGADTIRKLLAYQKAHLHEMQP